MFKILILILFCIINYTFSVTPAGTDLIFRNVTLSYQYSKSGIDISFAETEIEDTSITNQIESIFGITTTTTLNLTDTNILAPSSTVYYPYSLKNNGNDYATFNFFINDLINGDNSDEINLSIVDNNTDTATEIVSKTLVPQEEIDLYIKISIPDNFVASDIVYKFQFSNSMNSNENYRAVNFTNLNNNIIYGGDSPFLDTINIQVDSDIQVDIDKNIEVVNSAGGNILANEIIPSSQLKIKIGYSNKTTVPIANLVLTDTFDKTLVNYLVSSSVTTISGNLSYSVDGLNFTEIEPSITVGNINEEINYIRVNIPLLNPNENGTFEYTVVVK